MDKRIPKRSENQLEAERLLNQIIHSGYATKATASTVEVTPDKLIRIAAKVIDLVMRKNHDYRDAWQRQGINGVLVRLCDKLYRVENLVMGQEALVADERVEDTLRDAIGYALLGLLYMEERGSAIPSE